MNFTSNMLNILQKKIIEKLKAELPKNIKLTTFIVMSSEKEKIFCILSAQGDGKSDMYFKQNTKYLFELIEDATNLYWDIDEKNNFHIQSGYVVFGDGESSLYAFHKIEGIEMDLDSYWEYGDITKERTSNELGDWEYDLDDFSFSKELPIILQKIRQVILWSNGMVTVHDNNNIQMVKLQGTHIEARKKLKYENLKDVKFYIGQWPNQVIQITKENFFRKTWEE